MLKPSDLHLGWMALARPTFDLSLAAQIAGQARELLENAGFVISGGNELLCSIDEASAAAAALSNEPIDLLVLFQATFADSSMALEVARLLDAPMLLWAVPERPDGTRLRLNSLCGINLTAHALKRVGHYYGWLYASPQDLTVTERVRPLASAGRARRLLYGARIGRVGEHPVGFEPCDYDAEALRSILGLEVVPMGLPSVFDAALAVPSAEVEALAQRLSVRISGLEELDATATGRTLAACVALRQMARREHLQGLAIRCWPEFFTELGCAACGALSLLTDELTPCCCEADVNATVTQLILQHLSGEPAFSSDLVVVDGEKDVAVLWHCGSAPLSMADPSVRPGCTIHSNRKKPLLMDFALKPGRITLARLTQAGGSYRLVISAGEMLQAPASFSGTSGVMRFDRPVTEVLDGILREGLEHHFSLTYGDHTESLLILAEMLDLDVLHL